MDKLVSKIITHSFLIFGIVSFCSCTKSSKSNLETLQEDAELVVQLDSTQDAIFDMELNGEMWHKNDSATAKFTAKPPFEILYLSASHSSVFYQNLSFTAAIGSDFKKDEFSKRLLACEGDTLFASVYYAFADMNYVDGQMKMKNYLGLSMPQHPTAIIIITAVDTVKKQINGNFKGYVKDNSEETYKFRDGIFLNIPYHIAEVN